MQLKSEMRCLHDGMSVISRDVRSANKGVESPSLAASESRYIEELEILNVAYLALGERIVELRNKPETAGDVMLDVAKIVGGGLLQIVGHELKRASKYKYKPPKD